MAKVNKEATVKTEVAVPAFDQAHLDSLTQVSAKIRYLNSMGLSRGQIAKTTGKLYQHVRNVLITPLKKAS
jgi:hypothetical protein